MQVDIRQLEEWFASFNEAYFGGGLPVPKFAVGRSRTRLGTLSWKWQGRLFARRPCGYVLRVSNYYDADERHFKNVLLHEMIHLYVVSEELIDTSPHGVEFRKKMSEINAEGWNVTVSAKMSGAEKAVRERKRRQRVVLAVVMSSGKCLLSVVGRRYVGAVNRAVGRSSGVKSYSWYLSDDDYFADFPVVRTPRGRVVKRETYDRLTASMSRLGER